MTLAGGMSSPTTDELLEVLITQQKAVDNFSKAVKLIIEIQNELKARVEGIEAIQRAKTRPSVGTGKP
jgi:hypothetical protein